MAAQKLWTGSETGSRFVERILTVVTTSGRQGRSVLELLTTACLGVGHNHNPGDSRENKFVARDELNRHENILVGQETFADNRR